MLGKILKILPPHFILEIKVPDLSVFTWHFEGDRTYIHRNKDKNKYIKQMNSHSEKLSFIEHFILSKNRLMNIPAVKMIGQV